MDREEYKKGLIAYYSPKGPKLKYIFAKWEKDIKEEEMREMKREKIENYLLNTFTTLLSG